MRRAPAELASIEAEFCSPATKASPCLRPSVRAASNPSLTPRAGRSSSRNQTRRRRSDGNVSIAFIAMPAHAANSDASAVCMSARHVKGRQPALCSTHRYTLRCAATVQAEPGVVLVPLEYRVGEIGCFLRLSVISDGPHSDVMPGGTPYGIGGGRGQGRRRRALTVCGGKWHVVRCPTFTPRRYRVPLCLQDPTDPESEYLVDALVDACHGAHAGGGAFAFLSPGGVQLLLKDEEFSSFIEHGTFELIIGVDAITDTPAVDALRAVQLDRPGLSARVLVPTYAKSIFHPKWAWFDRGDGGTLLTGSGNLTGGGLRWNIEAFSVEKLPSAAMAELREQWDAFLFRTEDCLYDPGHPVVVKLLERNAARRKAMRRVVIEAAVEIEEEIAGELTATETELPPAGAPSGATAPVAPPTEAAAVAVPADELPAIGSYTAVLVAEIPRGGTRWEQANFHKAIFFDFFGASATVQRRVYLFHVSPGGKLGAQEVRPAVAVKSHNYRFELGAASGLAYPASGRPIAVFARVASRTFPYMLLMPGDDGHSQMKTLLDAPDTGPANRMREIVFAAEQVKAAWPAAPLWGKLIV